MWETEAGGGALPSLHPPSAGPGGEAAATGAGGAAEAPSLQPPAAAAAAAPADGGDAGRCGEAAAAAPPLGPPGSSAEANSPAPDDGFPAAHSPPATAVAAALPASFDGESDGEEEAPDAPLVLPVEGDGNSGNKEVSGLSATEQEEGYKQETESNSGSKSSTERWPAVPLERATAHETDCIADLSVVDKAEVGCNREVACCEAEAEEVLTRSLVDMAAAECNTAVACRVDQNASALPEDLPAASETHQVAAACSVELKDASGPPEVSAFCAADKAAAECGLPVPEQQAAMPEPEREPVCSGPEEAGAEVEKPWTFLAATQEPTQESPQESPQEKLQELSGGKDTDTAARPGESSSESTQESPQASLQEKLQEPVGASVLTTPGLAADVNDVGAPVVGTVWPEPQEETVDVALVPPEVATEPGVGATAATAEAGPAATTCHHDLLTGGPHTAGLAGTTTDTSVAALAAAHAAGQVEACRVSPPGWASDDATNAIPTVLRVPEEALNAARSAAESREDSDDFDFVFLEVPGEFSGEFCEAGSRHIPPPSPRRTLSSSHLSSSRTPGSPLGRHSEGSPTSPSSLRGQQSQPKALPRGTAISSASSPSPPTSTSSVPRPANVGLDWSATDSLDGLLQWMRKGFSSGGPQDAADAAGSGAGGPNPEASAADAQAGTAAARGGGAPRQGGPLGGAGTEDTYISLHSVERPSVSFLDLSSRGALAPSSARGAGGGCPSASSRSPATPPIPRSWAQLEEDWARGGEAEEAAPSNEASQRHVPHVPVSAVSPRMQSVQGRLPRGSPRPLQPRERPAPPPNEELQGDGDFFSRQPLTGIVCRMVKYREHERPAEDILSLCYTEKGRLIVKKIRTGGQAARASVAVGDELVSIDGNRDFHGRPSEAIRSELQGPTSLVFAGFVGKLEAEVRVEHTPHKVRCGLSPSTDVANDLQRVGTPLSPRVCDPVFFSAKESLFITTPQRELRRSPRGGKSPRRGGEAPEAPAGTGPAEAEALAGVGQSSGSVTPPTNAAQSPRIYELNKEDAKHLLQRVLRKTSASTPTRV